MEIEPSVGITHDPVFLVYTVKEGIADKIIPVQTLLGVKKCFRIVLIFCFMYVAHIGTFYSQGSVSL